jgi:uncharacterized protein (TIGR02246 family)
MPRPKLIQLATLLIVFAAAPQLSAQAETLSDALKQIEKANAEFMAAFARGDAKAVAGMYTERAWVLPPNQETVEGRAAIEAFWKATMDAGIKGVALKTREVEAFGDTAIETGTATVFGSGDAVVDEGKYVVIWKRDGGRWRLHRDCWNSSRPIAGK